MVSLLIAAFGAFLICGAFGLIYNIQSPKLLALAGAVGSLGCVAYQIVVDVGGGEPEASFVGAVVFSLAAWAASHFTHEPVIMFQAPALIPLVPGGDIYRMMSAFLVGEWNKGLQWGATALAVAGMLLFGMLIVSAVPYSWSHLKQLGKDTWHF